MYSVISELLRVPVHGACAVPGAVLRPHVLLRVPQDPGLFFFCLISFLCCGSAMLIPNPESEFFASRIPDPIFPSRIPDPLQIFKYFNPENWFLSSLKYDPGCSSRIRILFFYPSQIQGSRIRIRTTALFLHFLFFTLPFNVMTIGHGTLILYNPGGLNLNPSPSHPD
jgi:hypothetical protein